MKTSQLQNASDPLPPPGSASRRLRITVPLALVGFLLWLLVGCLYLPTGEDVHLTGSKKDFRSMPGYDAGNKPQVAGRFTREGIEAVLGPPRYASDNGRRTMYVLHARSGIWVVPLCFTVSASRDDAIGLLLLYDERGTLVNWKELKATGTYNPVNYNLTPDTLSEFGVLDLADELASTRPPASGHYSIPPKYPDPWALKYKR